MASLCVGPWRQMELVGVSGEGICISAAWKAPKSFCLGYSVKQFHFLCALFSTALCGSNTLLLSLRKAAQGHIHAVPKVFSSLGSLCGPAPCHVDISLSNISGTFLFEGFWVCFLNAKMKPVFFTFLNVQSDEQLALFTRVAFSWAMWAVILLCWYRHKNSNNALVVGGVQTFLCLKLLWEMFQVFKQF